MKACVTIRRDSGAVLAKPAPVVDDAALLELVVVEVTAPGGRRPIKVARVKPIGEQRILAQLLMPKLVRFVDGTMVLSGIEESRDDGGQVKGYAQTWVCALDWPQHAVGLKVRNTHHQGVALPKRGVRESSASRGKLEVAGVFTNCLQRHTSCAELYDQISTIPAARLVDCYIEWMSDTTFELGGLRVCEALQNRPQRLERNGWLCEFDVKALALTKHEARMLR